MAREDYRERGRPPFARSRCRSAASPLLRRRPATTRRRPDPAKPTSSSVAPTARAPSSPRTGICEQQSAKKKWRRRRRRPHHRAASSRCTTQAARAGRAGRSASRRPASRARVTTTKVVNGAPLSVLQIFRSVVDDPVGRAAPAPADIIIAVTIGRPDRPSSIVASNRNH